MCERQRKRERELNAGTYYMHTFRMRVGMFVCILTCMSQTKSPKTQVGGSVGNATQTVFNGVDGLVDCYIPKVKLRGEREGYITGIDR